MKKMYVFLAGAALSMLAFACSPSEEKEDQKVTELKKELTELRSSRDEINAKIAEREIALAKLQPEAKRSVQVKVADVEQKPFSHFLEVRGMVDSDKNIIVSPTFSGSVTKVLVTRGQFVRKGTLLAIQDAEAVRKNMDVVQTQLDLATEVFNKQKALWDQKVGTELQYLQAKSNKESLQNQMAALQEQFDMSRMKAPIEGTIDEVFLKEGQLTAPGQYAFRLIGNGELKIVAQIAESYIGMVQRNKTITLFFPDLNMTQQAVIKTVGEVIDPIDRTFRIEAMVKNATNLKANMMCYVKINDYNAESAVVIPVNVIQTSDADRYVFVVKDGKAEKRPVQTGMVYKNDVEIKGGLKAGEKIVVVGYQDLVDGQSVRF